MNNELIMSILTGLLVLVGIAQVMILINQKRQNQLVLLQEYRTRWSVYRKQWAILIFIGRCKGDYYQVAEQEILQELSVLVEKYSNSSPTVWALESVRCVCNTLSDVCIRVIQGQLDIKDVYPLFGSELLRQSRPLRVLLDVYYTEPHEPHESQEHGNIRKELQDWLIYHDGIRRRCLILIDLLWAEAVRLEDLSPIDIKSAADAKKYTGGICKKRLVKEIRKINDSYSLIKTTTLSSHLNNSEYRNYFWQSGICKKELQEREKKWIDMLLRN